MKSVDNGAALLDERLPGWRENIDTDALDLMSPCKCVLGELFGNYDRGLSILGLSHKDAQRLGFMVPSRTTWARLTDAWRKVLA